VRRGEPRATVQAWRGAARSARAGLLRRLRRVAKLGVSTCSVVCPAHFPDGDGRKQQHRCHNSLLVRQRFCRNNCIAGIRTPSTTEQVRSEGTRCRPPLIATSTPALSRRLSNSTRCRMRSAEGDYPAIEAALSPHQIRTLHDLAVAVGLSAHSSQAPRRGPRRVVRYDRSSGNP
jgi:hypothetical protein